MKLGGREIDKFDIEAVAKARVARSEQKSQTYWMFGLLLLVVVVALVPSIPRPISWGAFILALGGLLWNMNRLSTKQKIESRRLIKEWQQGQAAK